MHTRLPGAFAVAAALVLASAAPAVAITSSHTPIMAATTVLTGVGVGQAVFDVPREVDLIPESFDLHVEGGTYAFVRLVTEHQYVGCPAFYPNCVDWTFFYVRDLQTVWFPPGVPVGPGQQNLHNIPNPASFLPTLMHAYILTDGRATLTIRAENPVGLDLSVTVRTDMPLHGKVARLQEHCIVPCQPGAAWVAAGDVFDMGSTPGFAASLAESYAENFWQYNQTPLNNNGSYATGACFYPNPDNSHASPTPADHPLGCDPLPQQAADATSTVAGDANFALQVATLHTAVGSMEAWDAAAGPVYAGGTASSVNTIPSTHEFYGIWFQDWRPPAAGTVSRGAGRSARPAGNRKEKASGTGARRISAVALPRRGPVLL
jgi:hypothetical protein